MLSRPAILPGTWGITGITAMVTTCAWKKFSLQMVHSSTPKRILNIITVSEWGPCHVGSTCDSRLHSFRFLPCVCLVHNPSWGSWGNQTFWIRHSRSGPSRVTNDQVVVPWIVALTPSYHEVAGPDPQPCHLFRRSPLFGVAGFPLSPVAARKKTSKTCWRETNEKKNNSRTRRTPNPPPNTGVFLSWAEVCYSKSPVVKQTWHTRKQTWHPCGWFPNKRWVSIAMFDGLKVQADKSQLLLG